MTTRDFIRTAVLKTNPYWPFSRLNEVPYKIAIEAFAGLGKKFPEILSVYLRRPLIKGSWTPGLSDLDLGVIIDRRLTLEEEFSFLRSFWKNLNGLKKFFPMLGEIEVLNDDDIASWLKFGLEGYLSRNWMLLYGKEIDAREIPVNPKKLAMESLHAALRFYLGYFQDRLNPKPARPYLVSRDLQRIAAKILRCLNYPKADQNGKPLPLAPLEDKTAMICHIIKELEKSIRSSRSWDDAAGSGENDDREGLTNIVSRRRTFRENQTFDIGALAPCREAIQSIIMDFQKKIFIVLKDGLDSSTAKLCMDSVWRRFAGADKMPIIMSQAILNYMLRYYDPFQYADFVSRGAVAYGEDLLSEIPPPDKLSFVHNLLEQTATALTFPRSETLILFSESGRITQRQVKWTMEKSLALKLYLEKGIVESWYRDRLAQFQRHYPDYYQEIEALDKNQDGNRNGSANRKWFRRLREMADDIHHSLSASNSAAGLFTEKERNPL